MVYAVIFLILAVLVYLQFRTWQNFDWAHSWENPPQKWPHIKHGIMLIYLAYVVRAIQWKIFLRPVRPQVAAASLVSPTVVSFTGLALLGRPGELIRPYLIARRQNLSFSSQLAVWAVERIFEHRGIHDPAGERGCFFAAGPRSLPFSTAFARADSCWWPWSQRFRWEPRPCTGRAKASRDWIQPRFSHLAANLGHKIATRVREFRSGLNTIHSPLSLILLIALSVLMSFHGGLITCDS